MSYNLELLIEKTLEKCPDKNAKLTIELSGFLKQEIKPDAVSHKSNENTNQIPLENAPAVKPDFKKKRKDPAIVETKNA